MQVDILRLILIVLGGLLILGIYLWDRRKRLGDRLHALRGPRGQRPMRLEPTLGGGGEAPASPREEPGTAERADLEHALNALGDLVSQEERVGPRTEKATRKGSSRRAMAETVEERQQDLFAEDAVVDSDHYKHADPSLPVMILQINIVPTAKGRGFAGADLLRALEEVEMEPGEMQIFHRHDGRGAQRPVLFSMASMVEPGTFPLQAMDGFSTPGVTLFAQLPGPKDGIAVFSDMLFTAERLATALHGELRDETHSRLTKQTVEHLRSEILEHRRRVQLAKSKLR
jgi:cell division protein ZipA